MIPDLLDEFGLPISEDQAFSKRDAIARLEDLQFQIAIHLILVFSLPDSRFTSGWLKELNAWRSKIVRLRRGKKGQDNLPFEKLKKAIWIEPLEEEGDRVARIKEIADEKNISIPTFEDRSSEFKIFVFQFIDSILEDETFSPDLHRLQTPIAK